MDNAASKLPVRHEQLNKKNFLCCYVIYGLLLVGTLVVGFIQPIPIFKEKTPDNNLGTSLDLHNSKCSVDLYGRDTNLSSCWHHYFKFRHIWTQYFALDASFNLADKDVNVGLLEEVNLKVTWFGRKNMDGQCDAKKCSDCVTTWQERSLKMLDPTLNSNAAQSCMPDSCGTCNLQCYLCLRKVNPFDNTCKIYNVNTKEVENMATAEVCNDAFQSGGDPWTAISAVNQTISRTITCPKGKKSCNPSILFKTSHVEFTEFYFLVEIDKTERDHNWIQSVDFKMRYRNPDFSLYEIGFRSGFVIFNVLIWCLFECKVCTRKKYISSNQVVGTGARRGSSNASKMNQTMPTSATWLRVLQLGLLFFNNPVYALEYINDARRFFGIIGVILQVLFMAILMAYWLAEFESLASERMDAPAICEKTCSSLFRNVMIILFIVTSIPLYSYIKMQELSNPLYDFTEESEAWQFSKIFAGLWFCLYFFGLIYYTIKNFGINFCNSTGQCIRCCRCDIEEPERWRKSWIFVLHTFAIVIGVSGLAFGFTYGLEMDTVFEFLFFYALFNLYIHTLTFLYFPMDISASGISMSDMERLNDDDGDGGSSKDNFDSVGANI